MTDFVLDTSVTMRWCFNGGQNAYADAVLNALEAASGTAFIPVLWRYEVCSVLARAQVTGLVTPEKAADFLEDIESLDIVADQMGPDRVFDGVYQVATQYRLTGYDAAYLELAMRRNLALATLDAELRSACQAAGVAIF